MFRDLEKHKDKCLRGRWRPSGKMIVAAVEDRPSNRVAARVVTVTKSVMLAGLVSDPSNPDI